MYIQNIGNFFLYRQDILAVLISKKIRKNVSSINPRQLNFSSRLNSNQAETLQKLANKNYS